MTSPHSNRTWRIFELPVSSGSWLFVQTFHGNKSWWFVSSKWIYSLVKNKSVKLPFVTKNSEHFMGTSRDDSSALIEFTPLWKTKVSNYPLQLKNKNISLYVHTTRTKQSLPALSIVNVRTVSNLNSLVSSKTCPKN